MKMIRSIDSLAQVLSNHIRITNVHTFRNFSGFVQLQNKQKTFVPLVLSLRTITKKDASKKLQELLGLNPYRAHCIISNDVNFTKVPPEEMEKNYHLSLEQGLTKNTVDSFPSILADATLLYKFEILKMLPYDINLLSPLLLIPLNKLRGFVNDELEVNRIGQYSKLFQVDINDVCKWISAKPFLTSININNVQETVKILLDSGVTLQAIINDLWVLRYSPHIVEERISLAKENNIDIIKTWMVRAQREIFDNYVRRRSDTKEILGDKHDLVEYLSEKLECTPDVSKFLISKQPALQKKSLRKMDGMIDFLLANGFKPIHICRTPKILLHSVETIRKRLKELEANNMQLDSLHILTKSQRQYTSVFDSMKSNKGKIKNYFGFFI